MKTSVFLNVAIIALVIACCNAGKEKHNYQPIRSYEEGDSAYGNRYRLNEIIVAYRSEPTPAMVRQITASFTARGIDMESLKVTKCNSCEGAYVELWQAENINSGIHAEGISAGTVSDKDSDGVGEDGFAFYSLNFLSNVPVDMKPIPKNPTSRKPIEFSSDGKDTIKVAVLDTGIDTELVSPNLLWKNPNEIENKEDEDGNCYQDDTNGWNFIYENSDVKDDNPNLHGTLVSHYIINEFALSTKNFVQIMNLKTHDSLGSGDLFSSICAIHYAMNKGANIINASWGFYYYQEGPHPYLDQLITETLREKGILFVTAAGNGIADNDRFAKKAYYEEHEVEFPEKMLRNLEYHNFYPACLSRLGKNVITVTTTDGSVVSGTQNYSELFVDIGVMRDAGPPTAMEFKAPFGEPPALIRGSSFATAIASGKIGAYFPKEMYARGVDKDAVFEKLRGVTPPADRPLLITFEPEMQTSLIRKGKMTYAK